MFISLDLETTGFDPKDDQIIEFGAIKFDLEGNTETLQFLINPHTPIPQIVSHITNIHDEDVKNAPTFEEKKQEITDFIGNLPIVGHNIQFDTNFLRAKGIPLDNPEYDTFRLSSMLIPNLPSYSLEVLGHIFELQHEEAHRALDDAIAAMELFLKLIDEFQTLPEKTLTQIKALSQKSTSPIKNLIKDIQHDPSKTPHKTLAKVAPNNTSQTHKQILESAQNTLFQNLPPFKELSKTLATEANPETYIALAQQLFQEVAPEIPAKVAALDLPKNYLSTKRLKSLEDKEELEEYELTSLVKLLIWKDQTETGLLSEVKLVHEEAKIISRVNANDTLCNTKEEEFIQKSHQKDSNAAAICSHKYLIQSDHPIEKLIIINFEEFAKSLFFERSTYTKLPSLIRPLQHMQEKHPDNATLQSLTSKAELFFGMLELIGRKAIHKEDDKSFLHSTEKNLKEWTDLQNLIQSLIETSKELIEIKGPDTEGHLQNWKNNLGQIHEVFFNPDFENHLIWTETDYFDNFVLHRVATSIVPELNKIFERCQSYQIVDESLNLEDQGKYIKDLYDLDKDIPLTELQTKPENLEILLANEIFVNDQLNQKQLNEFFTKYFSSNTDSSTDNPKTSTAKAQGNTAIICNSKKQVQNFTIALSKACPKLNIVSQTTGSLGKLRTQFKSDSENSILICTNQLWYRFQDYELFHTIFIHKLPFLPPSDNFIVANSHRFSNPFFQLQIPQAIFALKKILNRFTSKDFSPNTPNTQDTKNTPNRSSRTAIVLDSRLQNKKYGKQFIENLNTIAPTQDTLLEQLLPNSSD